MRWPPIILDFALVIGMWTAVLAVLRAEHRRRARAAVDASPREARSYRLHSAAAICATVGVTFFFAWLIGDAIGAPWLQTLSLPAALILIAVAAVLSGYAGWVKGP